MRIGKFSVLVIITFLLNSCNPNIKRSRIVIQKPSYQEEIKTVIRDYVGAINTKDWISATNQYYIAKCNADSISARAKFLQYFQDGRLTSRMGLESLDFETKKIRGDGVEIALFNFAFKLDIDISQVPYSNAQLKENYLNQLKYSYGDDITIYHTDENKIRVGNLNQKLLAIHKFSSTCSNWKIMEYTDASKAYVNAIFDLDITTAIASHQR